MNRDEKTVNKEQWLLQNILLEIFLSLHCHTNENKQTKLAVVYKRYNRAKMLWLSNNALAFTSALPNANVRFLG